MPSTVAAQRVISTLDLNGVDVGYADSLHRRVASVAPAVSIDGALGSLNAAGLFAQELGGVWTTQGAVDGSLYFPLAPGASWLRGELGGSAGGSLHQDGNETGQLLARGRIHLVHPLWGGWIGGGGGQTWNGAAWRAIVLGDAGAWVDAGGVRFLITATPTSVSQGDGTHIRYTDVVGGVRWSWPRADVGGSVGTRTGTNFSAAPSDVTTWGNASLALWVLRSVAVTASAGTYPIDFTQGFPGGRFASLGLRLEARSGRRVRDRVSDPTTADAMARGVTNFELRTAAGERIFRVRAPGASRVDLSGDFTTWRPVALAPAEDGWWTVTLPVEAGVHQVNVRVNGGAWIAPPGLPPLTDEFGGVVGVLTVP